VILTATHQAVDAWSSTNTAVDDLQYAGGKKQRRANSVHALGLSRFFNAYIRGLYAEVCVTVVFCKRAGLRF